MRLLAGAQTEGVEPGADGDARTEWSKVIDGKWLAARLDELRSPLQPSKYRIARMAETPSTIYFSGIDFPERGQ